ncbi:linoleate diol synthase [Xylariomycetidae sp. FL0641]|nr:linoleate diol synthase [Xylariomycetidae sp. FL0641]
MTKTKKDVGLYDSNGVKATDSNSSTSAGNDVIPHSVLPEKEKPAPPPEANRKGVSHVFDQFGQWIQGAPRPVPTQDGDGSFYALQKKTGLKVDLKYLGKKDVKTVIELVKSKLKGEQLLDDKTMIMERTIQLVAGLPHHSRLREELTNQFLNELWSTLDHPPLLYLGDKHKYRMADGSWNNPMNPQLGAAGSTYARTCRPSIMPPGAQPDPGLIFDSVMARNQYRKHPNNVSSMLWYWATIIIHDLFWTDPADPTKTKTSSYLDLSPLYGSNQAMQDAVRTFRDGKMKPDAFADERLLGQPPGVGVLLVMFNRFHNHVAANLAAINENGRFTPPAPDLEGERAAAAWKKHDNDLFQTARLVTSGLYINITLVDYVRNIVNLNRSNTTWTLDPRAEMGKDAGTFAGAERGTGSMVSAEFNLCYRWHSCISAKDDQWIQDFYRGIFDKDPLHLSVEDMASGFAKFQSTIAADPGARVFGGFERQADGRFRDDDLVNLLCDCIEDPAGAFGGRNVPKAMKPVEILGILRGRKWDVPTLNVFRKHFGLKPYETFRDLNSDQEIAGALEFLYGHPDHVELYPGLVAEEDKKPMVPGVGIAPTYTISRVILSDAVCLTRGDRFYTTDYNPRHLTNWGYTEVAYDLQINQGCVFYKLFLRAFPGHFRPDSVYAHYPMCIPSETKQILTNLSRAADFSFARPAPLPPRAAIATHGGAAYVLDNPGKYQATFYPALSSLLNLNPSPSTAQQTRLLYPPAWRAQAKAFSARTASALLAAGTATLTGTRFVDAVGAVGNLAPVRLAARALRLPDAAYADREAYAVLALLRAAGDADDDPVRAFPLRRAAAVAGRQFVRGVEARVAGAGAWLSKVKGMGMRDGDRDGEMAAYGDGVLKDLLKDGLSAAEIAGGLILPAACALVPGVGEAFATSLDYHLGAGAAHLGALQRVASAPDSDGNDALLLGYCLEGVRLSGGGGGACREATGDDVIAEDDGRGVRVRAGARVRVSFAGTSKSAARFPSPLDVNPARPVGAYPYFGEGGVRDLAHVQLIELFRAVFRLRNLRRAPGPQGRLKRVVRPDDGAEMYMREDLGAYCPFPCSLKVAYDV